MRGCLVASTMVICFALSFSGCTASPSGPPSADPKVKERLAEKSAPTSSEVSVPNEIKQKLLSADDVKEGAELKAEMIGNGEGGIRLLIVGRGPFLCSPTGNCSSWIFRKTTAGYEQEVDLGAAQAVTTEKGKGQFPDVLARQHSSATDSDLRLYQFDGTQYHLTKCMDQSYTDPNDLNHILDNPIITESPCNR